MSLLGRPKGGEMSLHQAALAIGMCERRLSRLCRDRLVPHRRIKGPDRTHVRIPRAWVEAILTGQEDLPTPPKGPTPLRARPMGPFASGLRRR